jgi:hypothetical protein
MEVYVMARKNRTPEENERRAKIRELLQMGNINSMDDIQICSRRPLRNSWKTAWRQNWTMN